MCVRARVCACESMCVCVHEWVRAHSSYTGNIGLLWAKAGLVHLPRRRIHSHAQLSERTHRRLPLLERVELLGNAVGHDRHEQRKDEHATDLSHPAQDHADTIHA